MRDLPSTDSTLFRPLQLSACALATLALVLFVMSGCDANGSTGDNGGENTVSERVGDLAADPYVGFVEGRPVGTGRYTFFSLREDNEIAAADSATTAWDIALQGTNILINGGTSGPGSGAAQVVNGIFEEIKEAPADGWSVDGSEGPAIAPGSGNGWYNYNPTEMVITPIPGRVILVRTADGLYAKISIISYYEGAPDAPTSESTARYYTFDFVLQQDGSRSFE